MSTCGKRGCCCCCNKRDLTVLFGFILAAIAVAVPIVIHETDQEYGLTVIKFIRQYLGQNEVSLPKDQQLHNQQLNPHQKYKYASDLHHIYTQSPIIKNGLIRNDAEILGIFKERRLSRSKLRNA